MITADSLRDWQVDLTLTAGQVDLNNCDREPIHIPGAIQPHGLLLTLDPEQFTILQVSDNSAFHLGLSPEQLLGCRIDQWFSPSLSSKIQGALAQDFEHINPISVLYYYRASGTSDSTQVYPGVSLSTSGEAASASREKKLEQASERTLEQTLEQTFNAIVHRTGEVVVLELEPVTEQYSPASFFDFYSSIKVPLNRLQAAQTTSEICEVVTQEVRRICQFDRVMIYRFEEDGSGYVLAESRRDDLEPFLGLHYPDSDIPKQAKQLYIRNKLRIIPDIRYEPAALIPPLNPLTQQPTDLSDAALRSVSPLHLEYLGNMGVSASMSISIVQDGNLWGLIACHHGSPHLVGYELRTVCEFLGQVTAIEIAAKEKNESLDYRMSLNQIQTHLIQASAQAKNLIQAIAK